MATRRVGSTRSLYDIALSQMRQRSATGQPSLPSGFWNDALYAANLAELESARGEESREEELAFRREQFESQQAQAERTEQRGVAKGYAELAVNAPMSYLAAKQLGLFGGPTAVSGPTAGVGTQTAAGGEISPLAARIPLQEKLAAGALTRTTATMGAETAYMGYGGAGAESVGYGTQGAAVGGGPAATPWLKAGGYGAAAGYVGAKYGPLKKESGEMATLGMGGEKEKKVAGGGLRGAGAGAIAGGMATSWSGPGVLVGMAVGAVVGALVETDTVICTELARQGYIEQEYLDLEHRVHWDFATYWGYRILADPVVTKMKTSKALTLLILPFAKAFLKEVAHRVEPKRSGSFLGSLLIKLGIPICQATFFHFADQLAWPAKYKFLEKIQTWKEN